MVKITASHYKFKPFFMLLLLFMMLFTTIAQAANITVSSSRNPVALDDSFHLIYEADSDVDDEPDFAPIYEHFDVLNSAQSTNMRFINGQYSLKKSWDLSLIAKDIGKFTIPAISFGKDISPAIQITVTNSTSPNSLSPNGASTIPAKIFVESSIDKKQGWVQSQFIYSVRLLRTVSIASASLSEPQTSDADAIIEPLGEDSYQTTRNGIRYEVFERRYAIFPQKSGVLKINPVTFEGRVNATQPRTIFDQFRMSGQLKRLRSNSVEVKVKAAPASVNLQDWLPASKLQLEEEWSDEIQNIKAGEPVTRTITIAAEGLTGVQLPDLSFAEVDGLKQYPDKAVVENRPDVKGITGIKQLKIALIPASAGSYTLPEITLQWWNTKTNKTEFARIPESVITATGGAQKIDDTKAAPVVSQSTVQADSSIAAAMPDTDDDMPVSTPARLLQTAIFWQGTSLAFALAWLLTLLLLLKKPRTVTAAEKPRTEHSAKSIKNAASRVKKFAGQNDARQTKTALTEWAKQFYANDSITNLTQIGEYCSAPLTAELKKLDKALYSNEHAMWSGESLLHAFKDEQVNLKKQHKQTPALKPLFNIEE